MGVYSKEFRLEVLAACDAGEECRSVAVRFKVSESWIRRIKQERRETGKIEPSKTRNRKRVWESWQDWLTKKIDQRPDIYLREIQADLKEELNVEVSVQTICRACQAVNRTRKKRR